MMYPSPFTRLCDGCIRDNCPDVCPYMPSGTVEPQNTGATMVSSKSAEQQARDLLERYGVEDAQSWSAGDLIELANLIADANAWRSGQP